jgi:hypothetical protein
VIHKRRAGSRQVCGALLRFAGFATCAVAAGTTARSTIAERQSPSLVARLQRHVRTDAGTLPYVYGSRRDSSGPFFLTAEKATRVTFEAQYRIHLTSTRALVDARPWKSAIPLPFRFAEF